MVVMLVGDIVHWQLHSYTSRYLGAMVHWWVHHLFEIFGIIVSDPNKGRVKKKL